MSSVHLRRLQIGSFARWTGTAFLNDPFPRGRYVHAAQGDGEACGSGLETSAEVAFRFGLLRQKTIGWPRLEDAEHLMVAASARPLTDALRIAFVELVGWLADDHGFSRPDAYQLVSQVQVPEAAPSAWSGGEPAPIARPRPVARCSTSLRRMLH
ncbi:MAG TPA: hypothetical protein VLL75_15110 [Vicinamibacteria bacterium]|jgi:hypothetical protein|nr:hypothetical protein [Vicinamibacteria bacterium]